MTRAAWTAAVASLSLIPLVVVGCPDADSTTEYNYAAYEGDAYPSRYSTIEIPPGGLGFIPNSRGDSVSVVDLTTGEAIAERPVGRNPIDLDGPHHLAVDPVGGNVYVALSYPQLAAQGPHAQHGSATALGYVQRLSLQTLEILGQVRVDANPGDVVVSEDGKRLIVTHFDLDRAIKNPTDIDAARATLALIDPTTIGAGDAVEPIRIPTCVAPHGVALSRPDASTAYVACFGEDSLAIVDLDNPSADVRYVPLGAATGDFGAPSFGPYAAILSPDGKTIAVSSTESRDVRFFDVDTETFVNELTISTFGAPYFTGWTSDSKRLYIPTQAPDSVLLIDVSAPGTPVVVRDFDAGECPRPHVVERVVHAGQDTLMLICEGDWTSPGIFMRLDPETLETLSESEVGLYPDALVSVRPEDVR